MHITLTIDPAERHDTALTETLRDWLHANARGSWAVIDTKTDSGLVEREYRCNHPLDVFAICFRKCASYRARRA